MFEIANNSPDRKTADFQISKFVTCVTRDLKPRLNNRPRWRERPGVDLSRMRRVRVEQMRGGDVR